MPHQVAFDEFLVIALVVAAVPVAAVLAALVVLRRATPRRGEPQVPATSPLGAGDLHEQAHSEADRVLTEARRRADQLTADAHREAGELASDARRKADEVISDARRQADESVIDARQNAAELTAIARRDAELAASAALIDARRVHERESAESRAELERREHRLSEREERLDGELERVAAREAQLSRHEDVLARRSEQLDGLEEERRIELERLAGLSAEAARAELVQAIETAAKREAALLVRDIEAEARDTGEQRARHIVVGAIQRVASEQTAESVVSVLHLPSDDMKGRIIGREGRNIRAFEQVTGVNLIIDDTPEAVLLSCFDPVRREVGRITLETLVLDGRIHPHRIEEVHERSKEEVEALCLRAGEDALIEVGITGLHPDLLLHLGHLRYRTSYGQNVLKHLIETAHIAGLMAAELHMNPQVVKRAAFLHDIGKALTHESEGSHALVGADLARKCGESDDVVHAIEAHHNEVAPSTIEAVLTQASDSCSGGRPGARRESLETYVKRLERIEEICGGNPGVDRVFAMQAGREVRVMVQPDAIDDLAAQILARDVAKQIEEELSYPGQIRVTVVRESRATEIAR